jgi:hypothetical protein
MSDDRRSCKRCYAILLPTSISFYEAVRLDDAKLIGRVDLRHVERLRSPCVRPATIVAGTWPRPTPYSFDIGDATSTSVLFAESQADLDGWLRCLQELIGTPEDEGEPLGVRLLEGV